MTPDQISKLPPELRKAWERLTFWERNKAFSDAVIPAVVTNLIYDLGTALTWGLQVVEERDAAIQRDYDRGLANCKNVCASDVFQELKHGRYKIILYLLANGSISVGKAAQSIAELAHTGEVPFLPTPMEELENLSFEDEVSWKDRAETAEATIATLTAERDEARAAIPPDGDGSCDHCGKVPSIIMPTSLCNECVDGVTRAETAEAEASRLRGAIEKYDRYLTADARKEIYGLSHPSEGGVK